MSVIENFLVNTNNFDSIIQTLINDQDVPSVVTDSYFKSLGFQNPSDLLVIHLMKGLNILEEDGSTTDRFNELKNPSTTQKAIAKGVVEAYEGLFRMEPQIYKMQHDELQKIFSEVFAGQKSELIFKYMANTFSKLVSYAGTANIEQALNTNDHQEDTSKPEAEEKKATNEQDDVAETVQEHATNTQTNGVQSNGIDNNVHVNGQNGLNGHADHAEPESAANPEPKAAEPKSETPKEEKGNISFEDLVGLNSTNSTDTESRPVPQDNISKEEVSSASDHQVKPEPSESSENAIETNSDNGSVNHNNGATDKSLADEPMDHPEEFNPFDSSNPPANTHKPEEPKEEPSESKHNVSSHPIPDVSVESSKIKDDQKVQKALIKKADLLYKLKRYESLLPTLDEIIAYFDRANEPFLKEAVSTAVIRRAFVLYNLSKYDQALPALDRVITRFSYSDNKNLYEQASLAMLYKANILEEKDLPQQVLPLYNSIIERLGHSDNPELREQIDEIFLKRLDMLFEAGRTEEVLAAANQLIERFKYNQDKLQYLEEAMFKKAEILENLNKYEEALEAYSNFLEKFGQNISIS